MADAPPPVVEAVRTLLWVATAGTLNCKNSIIAVAGALERHFREPDQATGERVARSLHATSHSAANFSLDRPECRHRMDEARAAIRAMFGSTPTETASTRKHG